MRVRFFVVFASVLLIGAVWTAAPGAAVQTTTALPPPAVAHKLERQQELAPTGPQARIPADDSDDSVPILAGLVGTGGGGLTALVFAAREGDIASARALLDGGADVNQTTEYGWTPLLAAQLRVGNAARRAGRRRQSRQQGRLDAALSGHR